MTTTDGNNSKYLLTSITPHHEERFLRDEQTNELYLPLTSTVVLKLKEELLYVSLDIDKYLTVDALVDSRAHVSAISQKVLDTIKEKAANNIFKIDELPIFQIQVANGQLENLLVITRLKFDIGDKRIAEHFVVMKKLRGPIIGLHFMRINSVVIDTIQGLKHSSHLTMQVKSTSKRRAKPQVVFTYDALTIPPRTTKTITVFIDHASEWKRTGTLTPLNKFIETASLLISHSMLTRSNKKVVAVRVTITAEAPYLI